MSEFNWTVRVYYEDTDAGGVVYHASYLKFMERARTEWLREIGYSQTALRRDQGLVFAVTGIDMNFRQAARIDDLLEIHTTLGDRGGASLLFKQVIRNQESELVCDARVRIACLDAGNMKPRRLPESIIMELGNVN